MIQSKQVALPVAYFLHQLQSSYYTNQLKGAGQLEAGCVSTRSSSEGLLKGLVAYKPYIDYILPAGRKHLLQCNLQSTTYQVLQNGCVPLALLCHTAERGKDFLLQPWIAAHVATSNSEKHFKTHVVVHSAHAASYQDCVPSRSLSMLMTLSTNWLIWMEAMFLLPINSLHKRF